ncbi:hypothetical protein F441_20243 [Phytophthora nicotianae CJ01A1]|uniref:Uncharacterized protein n=4 Tax=Phytophthora nicotianae TaxID=4792 RepID=W2QTI6_PHYN3|nr:hypothetical protein PPTG_21733 [Phytophthora nicotianae INRA-310]ETM33151.1 hypothetical protein L914_19581 [Phytophthora nicotianae]ETN16507.1 hypothetical protein PPTG_21733 [Phytophthora nicotianae INRA-310]ETO61648.1 hypothetical protein F444_20372 [Phytophthora nicotianae P1976]ETP02734.1 hypothetical protein F441_20243 [Phytophthora nicotianae CJ01A1]
MGENEAMYTNEYMISAATCKGKRKTGDMLEEYKCLRQVVRCLA